MATAPEADPKGPEEELPEPKSMWAPEPVLIVMAMAAGSIAMWAGGPLFWLWFGAKVTTWTTGDTRLSAPVAAMILIGIIATAIVIGKILGILNRRHMRLTGLDRHRRHARAWNKSMRDDRENTRDRGLLEPVMFASLGFAALLFAVWFFAFSSYIGPG